MPALESRERRSHEQRPEGVGRENPHRAAHVIAVAGAPARRGDHRLHDILDPRGPVDDLPTDRRETPAIRRTVEKSHPQCGLETVDPAAHGGVLDSEHRGRRHHAPGPGDSEQIAEVIRTHIGTQAHAPTLSGAWFTCIAPGREPVLTAWQPGDVGRPCDTSGMDATLTLIIGLAVGLALGAVVGVLVGRARRTQAVAGADPALLAAQHESRLAAVRAELGSELAAAQATLAGLREQLGSAHEQYRDLMERTRREAEQRAEAERAESKVLQALAPVKESLSSMQQKVTDLEQQRSVQHGELAQQLKSAVESEERLRTTAESLASALKNNATRGVWGETQLRAVVESAGMMEHVNFDVQSSIKIDSRTSRPDMVVTLPGGKSIAVDAKVPFNAYLDAAAILPTANDAELARRETLMKQHVKAVRDHIVALGARSYWDGLDSSPEMVIAFIPSESLLSAALEADPSVMEFAFSKHVALASPVTLFSVLKAVAVSWRHEVVTQEAKNLFDVSRELYGRLTKLAGHVDKLGRTIERSVKDYNSFVGSFERQVLPSARRISQLDSSKLLPPLAEIDELPRELTASDLTAVLDDRVVEELAALDETGVARPELDFDLVEPPTPIKKPKTA
jgi:DNA recombination protein RmuC